MSEKQSLELKVCGESFRLRVEADEVERLRKAAARVEEKIGELQKAGAGVTMQRLAILAALEMAHERIREQEIGAGWGDGGREAAEEVTSRLDGLIKKVDRALGKRE